MSHLFRGKPGWADAPVPASLLHSTLAPDVLDYLQRSLVSSLELPMLHRRLPLRGTRAPMRITVASKNGHSTRQAFLHGMQTMTSVHGSSSEQGRVQKGAAPRALRALLEYLRQEIAPGLLRSLAGKDEVGRILRALISDGRLFADVNVQLHSGATVPLPDVYWHVDKPNSAVHLGISLFGHRRLHVQCGEICNVSETEQVAGTIYLSSPAAFVHGVEYPYFRGGTLARSILAIQARILMPNRSAVEHLDEAVRDGGGIEAFSRLATALQGIQTLKLPSLSELRAVERSLARNAAGMAAGNARKAQGRGRARLDEDVSSTRAEWKWRPPMLFRWFG